MPSGYQPAYIVPPSNLRGIVLNATTGALAYTAISQAGVFQLGAVAGLAANDSFDLANLRYNILP
jgi:hypothetical protein